MSTVTRVGPVSEKGPFLAVASVLRVAASEANYGVGVQVKIHPPPPGGPFSRGPTQRVSETFENISQENANH